jgi:LacI family transcriptional regulator
MDDVARAAGVSKATVSRVLAGAEGSSSAETAEMVRETARRLGYVLNSVASSLRSRQTHAIGLVIADVSNPFFGGIARGVEERLAGTGYSVIFGSSDNSPEREWQLVRLLVERQIDGLIAATSASESKHFLNAQQSGVAVVLVDSDLPGSGLDSVTIDNYAAAAKGIRHLLSQGHRRIGVVTGPLQAVFDRHRLDGCRAAMDEAGGAELLIIEGDLEATGGERAARTLMRRSDPPSAVLVTNNMMSLGFLTGLTGMGLRVPQDVSMIAFDDQDWYAVIDPPLTGISNPARALGYAAADRLLARMAGEGASGGSVKLDAHLIERASVRPLARAVPPRRRRAAKLG